MTNYRIADEKDRSAVIRTLTALDVRKPWFIVLKREAKKRTLSQNNLYWVWCELIAKETGNAIDDTHEAIKKKFCPAREVWLGDESHFVQSTAKLETQAMSEFMDQVYAWATSEMGLILPVPEEGHDQR